MDGSTVLATLMLDPNATYNGFTVAADDNNGIVVSPACFCPGTAIATPSGDRPIETLAIGDAVLSAEGAVCPILWIGRRSYAGRLLAGHPLLHPIRIRAGALGGGLPRRDLLVSAEHAMMLDGLLVPARMLVNGTSIVRERPAGPVHYLHIELAQHGIILAEGAATETFVDDESRGRFHNAAEFAALYPDRRPARACYCAPRVESGPLLEAIRRRLATGLAA
jgi:hypothetical protein